MKNSTARPMIDVVMQKKKNVQYYSCRENRTYLEFGATKIRNHCG